MAKFVPVATFAVGVAVALAVRPNAVTGIVLLFLLFVPLERVARLRPQKVFRHGLLTDLTHLLVNNLFVTAGTVLLVVVAVVPFVAIRRADIESQLPTWATVPLAALLVFVGNYWAHRLTHRVPFLWRFHSVHHSIEIMDFAAAGRLHPFDSAFVHAFTVLPLVLLGYDGGVFAGTTVVVALLAIFQHANVRLRFPGLRWFVNTPEWHHWHHAIDARTRDVNFGLPVVDVLFGTAYLPKGRRPEGFGIDDPVPAAGYLRHLAYPFTHAARSRVRSTPSLARETVLSPR